MKFVPSLLLPREDKFFILFKSSAANMLAVSKLLVDLMEDYTNVPQKAEEIGRLEEEGDHIIHEIMRSLHQTFVTPFDREDIAELAKSLDDVVDTIEEVARTMVEYRIGEPTQKARELAQIVQLTAEALKQGVDKLHFRGAKLREILPHAVEVNRLENEADKLTSRAVGELFSDDDIRTIEVLKWREIYNLLEAATDRCEDAADVLEGIVLEHA